MRKLLTLLILLLASSALGQTNTPTYTPTRTNTATATATATSFIRMYPESFAAQVTPRPTLSSSEWNNLGFTNRSMHTIKDDGIATYGGYVGLMPVGETALVAKYVSEAINTCTGACTMGAGAYVTARTIIAGKTLGLANTNIKLSWRAFVIDSANNMRCTISPLVSITGSGHPAAAAPASMAGGNASNGGTCLSTAVEAGDRIVFEVGAYNNTASPINPSYGGTYFGGLGADFTAAGQELNSDQSGWFDFPINGIITWVEAPTHIPTATPTYTQTPTITPQAAPCFTVSKSLVGGKVITWGGNCTGSSTIATGSRVCVVSVAIEQRDASGTTAVLDGNNNTMWAATTADIHKHFGMSGPCMVGPVTTSGSGRVTMGWYVRGAE